jgi:hypothetical protein
LISPALEDALTTCRHWGVKLPAQLAAWLIAHEMETNPFDQAVLGQALYELLGGPGPDGLAEIIARMVHPEPARRWPQDGNALRAALYGWVSATGRPAGAIQVEKFLSAARGLPRPKDSGEWLNAGNQLDASGRVVGPGGPLARPSPSAFGPKKPKDEALELARPVERRAPNAWAEPAPYRDEVRRPRGRAVLYLVLALAVLGGAAVGAFMFIPNLQRKIPFDLPRASHALLITSTPDGATVVIEGKEIGTTPYAGDNRWAGRVRVELRLEGFEPFKDTFAGGKDQSIAATLKRKQP